MTDLMAGEGNPSMSRRFDFLRCMGQALVSLRASGAVWGSSCDLLSRRAVGIKMRIKMAVEMVGERSCVEAGDARAAPVLGRRSLRNTFVCDISCAAVFALPRCFVCTPLARLYVPVPLPCFANIRSDVQWMVDDTARKLE